MIFFTNYPETWGAVVDGWNALVAQAMAFVDQGTPAVLEYLNNLPL